MSLSTPSADHCPRCGSALDPAAPQNPCPRCLFSAAMAPTQSGGAAQRTSEPLSPAALAPHFPQLEILECLGRGGMGVVYKARQKALGRIVALKILAPERSTDPGFAERFTAEARMLASLNHPNIVTIHDFGESGGFYHLVMEYVDGVNLRQAMTAGRFTPEQALAIVPPVCEALQYAHDHGVVHRDIKPENLLLDQQGRVKVADFGIAKLLGSATAGGPDAAAAGKVPADAPPAGAGAGGPETLGASAAGTPQYMAPEQRARGAVDHRADIYSLGVVLYELLTGTLPGHSLKDASRRIQVDVRLDEVVLRALAVAPELRFPTATEFRTRVEALTAPATPAPIQAPPQKPASVPSPYRALLVVWFLMMFAIWTSWDGAGSLVRWLSRLFHQAPVVSGTWPPAVPPPVLGPPAQGTITLGQVSNGTVPRLQILPAQTPGEVAARTIFKEIVLEGFTNLTSSLEPYCRSHTPFRPGESLEVWTKRSDGQLELDHEQPSTYLHRERRSQILGIVFRLPKNFTGSKQALIEELGLQLEGRTLRLPEGQPLTLFGQTNVDGSWLAGGLTFRRTLPDDREPAVAAVRLASQHPLGESSITADWTGNVPPGHALGLRVGGSEAGRAHVNWQTDQGRDSVAFTGHWHWMVHHHDQGNGFDSAVALKQLESLAAAGPLLVTNGHPRTLFAVTNALGESYSLAIELLSAKDTDP